MTRDNDDFDRDEWHDDDEPGEDLPAVDLDQYSIIDLATETEDDLDRETVEALPPKPELADVVESLERGDRHLSELYGFSDLNADDIQLLESRWPLVDPDLRARVVQELVDLSLESFEYELSRFFRFATTDEDPRVRQIATGALGLEADKRSLERLVEILVEDTSDDVRAEAAGSLGPFANYAVYHELPDDLAQTVERVLFDVAEDEDESWHVRRKAAESVAIFGPSARVEQLVQRMWDEDELGLRASALYAIGRGNLGGWLDVVNEAFGDEDAAIRFEAVRAAGELGRVDALPELSEIARTEDDVDVRHAAIAAIGAIGGPGAIRILRRLAESEDARGTDQDVIDDALIEASLESDPLSFGVDPGPN